MSVQTEVELLKRQNRRLKVGLFTTITVLIVAGTMLTLVQHRRAESALRMAEQARQEAVHHLKDKATSEERRD